MAEKKPQHSPDTSPADDSAPPEAGQDEATRSSRSQSRVGFAGGAGLALAHGDKRKSVRRSRRLPSPPPPCQFNRRVSFNTFANPDAPDYSLTLNYKHNDYKHTRRSRTFLCGTDLKEYSEFALEWLLDELVDDGDEVVCLRSVEKDSKIASDASINEGLYRQEAEKLFKSALERNVEDKAISLVMELAVGKVQDIIQRMIEIYEPAVLVVGTRGRSLKGMQGLLPGSVSKYCLQQSPIPVIVVRPTEKREKKRKERALANASLKGYDNMLRISETRNNRHPIKTASAHSSATGLPYAATAEARQSGSSDLPLRSALKSSGRGSDIEPESGRTSVSSTTSGSAEGDTSAAQDKQSDYGSLESEKAPATSENSPGSSDPSFADDQAEANASVEKTGDTPDPPSVEGPKVPVVTVQSVPSQSDPPPVDAS